MKPLRNLLFVPGNRADMLGKVAHLAMDALVPDLEDSVPSAEKPRARQIVSAALPSLTAIGKPIIVRVNSIETGLLEDDLGAVVGPYIYAISLPKVDSPWVIYQVDVLLTRMEKRLVLPLGQIGIIPYIETARGVVNAYQISSASLRVVAVSFGAEDLTEDMGIQRSATGEEVLYSRSAIAVAAHSAGISALDTPYLDFRDLEGLRTHAEVGVQLGYQGMYAIHPAQLAIINQVYSPSEEAIAVARKIVMAFEEAESRGRGAISMEGKVIDIPIVKRARKLLALAQSQETQHDGRNVFQ